MLRIEVTEKLSACDAIVHAGDIGDLQIIERLREIAPVHAVHGNTDKDWCRRSFPKCDVTMILEMPFCVIHDLDSLDLDPGAAGIDVVVSGHTHEPEMFEQNGVLFINPGSAGPRRFDYPISMALLHLNNGKPKTEFITLG